mgnify:CR=1 FL=1
MTKKQKILHTKTKILMGVFGVDSGQVMIGDPCYLKYWSDNNFNHKSVKIGHDVEDIKDFSYNGACKMTLNNKQGGELKNKNGAVLSVVSSTGYGDGAYPVYAIKEDGRIKELTIQFF